MRTLVKKKKLPARPMAIATAPVHDPHLDRVLASEVTSELINFAYTLASTLLGPTK